MNYARRKLLYEFGDFSLDPFKNRLHRGGELIPLSPRVAKTLCALVERHGQLVERDELMDLVWHDVAVEDGNLTVTVSVLRKILGEDAATAKFIETVPRVGYRFVADVREVSDDVGTLVVEKQTLGRVVINEYLTPHGLRSIPPYLFSTSTRMLATVGVAVAVITIGSFAYFSRSGPTTARVTGVRSIAVLPFKTLDEKDKDSPRGLALTDILITRLSNIKEINVRPTSAVASLEYQSESSASLGRKLQVDAVLEGSIFRSGDNVRITTRLIRVSDLAPIWAGQFEKTTVDELQLQNEIALQVVDALALHLSDDEKRGLTKHYTDKGEAYQLYVRGRYEWNKRNVAGLFEAERLFRNAIEKDPNFALAYVGFADRKAMGAEAGEAFTAINKALELDPDLAEAYATSGFLNTFHRWNWTEAEQSFRKSIELNPGYATAHHWYAILLAILGRNDEAKTEMRRALEIDPTSHNFLADLGQTHYFAREYDKAEEYCLKALEMYPDFVSAYGHLTQVYLQNGQYEKAVESKLRHLRVFDGYDGQSDNVGERWSKEYARQRAVYAQGGIRRFLENGLVSKGRNANIFYAKAMTYAFLGEKDKALDNLEKAYEGLAFLLVFVKADPAFDNLRAEPRYQAILQKMNLPPDKLS